MRNVFRLISGIKTEFTALEKALLDDIAMDFRNRGIQAKFCLYPQSKTALAKFIDFRTGEQYIHVSKHQDQGVVEYKVTHSSMPPETYLNFKDVLIDCKNYIAAKNTSQEEAQVVSLQSYRKG